MTARPPRSGVAATWLAPLLVVALLGFGLWWFVGRDTGSNATTTTPAGRVAASSTAAQGPAATARSTPRRTAPATHGSPAASTPVSGLATIVESRLPRQAQDTLALIRAGGPYPYRQDDAVWQNREAVLPSRARGYYREYTVETPGSPDRGPRRIIAGQGGDLYWTTDHYASFRQILEGQ